MAGTREGGIKAAETLKKRDIKAMSLRGKAGAAARHSKSPEKESEIARKAAATRKERDPNAFRKMGKLGGLVTKRKKDENSAL